MILGVLSPFRTHGQRPGTERSFFTVDEGLLRRFSQGSAWSPEPVADSPARQLFDRAQLARRAYSVFGGQAVDRGSGAPAGNMPSHSLSVNTYPAKARDIGESREIGLERISTAQGVLFVVVVVALAIKGFMTLWLYQPKVAVLIILLLAGTLLSGICMIPQMLPQPGPKMFREGEPVAIERRSKSAATHAVGEHLARRIAPGVCP